jgi:hypothetical protein
MSEPKLLQALLSTQTPRGRRLRPGTEAPKMGDRDADRLTTASPRPGSMPRYALSKNVPRLGPPRRDGGARRCPREVIRSSLTQGRVGCIWLHGAPPFPGGDRTRESPFGGLRFLCPDGRIWLQVGCMEVLVTVGKWRKSLVLCCNRVQPKKAAWAAYSGSKLLISLSSGRGI